MISTISLAVVAILQAVALPEPEGPAGCLRQVASSAD